MDGGTCEVNWNENKTIEARYLSFHLVLGII
jgi:hypothetical protein